VWLRQHPPLTPHNDLAWVWWACRWAPSFVIVTYRGSKYERRDFHSQIRENRFNVLLTTYEMIIRDRAVLCKVPWGLPFRPGGHAAHGAPDSLTSSPGRSLGATWSLTRATA
jgi:hypothetical protein